MYLRKGIYLPLLLILAIAVALRFYNLLWGAPYFFNPDERNMANAIAQFKLPLDFPSQRTCILTELKIINHQSEITNCNLNPHFFAYGHFPLYLAFFSGILFNSLTTSIFKLPTSTFGLTFPQAIFWLRFWSAVASTLTIPIVYLITKKLIQYYRGGEKRFCEPDIFCGDDKTMERKNSIATKLTDTNKSSPSQHVRHISSLAFIAGLFATFTPGLIQAAHMGTTESFLAFFLVLLSYLSIKILTHRSPIKLLRTSFIIAIILGLSLGTKLSGVVFATPVAMGLISWFVLEIQAMMTKNRSLKHRLAQIFFKGLFFISVTGFILAGSLTVALSTSPFFAIDYKNFRSTSDYEISVARGKSQVFYTRQFINTRPFLFQIDKVFPYTLGWPVFILGICGFILAILFTVLALVDLANTILTRLFRRSRQNFNLEKFFNPHLVVIVAFLSYLIPNALLFAKWTRFMTPIFPLFSVFASFTVWSIITGANLVLQKCQMSNVECQIIRKLGYWIIGLLVIISLLPGVAFMSIYTHEDSRLTASRWIYANIPSGTHVLSETANVIDIPIGIPNLQSFDFAQDKLTTYNLQPISFDFYHLDEDPTIQDDLISQINKAEYIFVPSRRLFINTQHNPDLFPLLNRYYQVLFSGELGFEEVARFTSFPKLEAGSWKLEAADEEAEETWTVFDHPVIRIYRKVKPMTRQDYNDMLNI